MTERSSAIHRRFAAHQNTRIVRRYEMKSKA
nr:MAG TPA: hypothetical protein [Caudoviricetes sp.]DAM17942.1 MAG TPA: hypothetical protein [Caudoviricetes sp.]DAW17637.1 MAG TPA: hypothetical protein [Caudoviricetes sp.]